MVFLAPELLQLLQLFFFSPSLGESSTISPRSVAKIRDQYATAAQVRKTRSTEKGAQKKKKKQRQRERVSGRWVEEVKKRRQQKRKTWRQKKKRYLMSLCFLKNVTFKHTNICLIMNTQNVGREKQRERRMTGSDRMTWTKPQSSRLCERVPRTFQLEFFSSWVIKHRLEVTPCRWRASSSPGVAFGHLTLYKKDGQRVAYSSRSTKQR